MCQDVSFHQVTGINYSVRCRQSPDYTDKPTKQRKSMPMKIPQGRDEHISNRQDNNLWVKVPDDNTEIVQRQDFNDYELIHEEYLRSLEMTDNTEQSYPPER